MIDAASVGSALLFWFTISACGLLAWPLAAALFPQDDDFGFLAAKPLAWLVGAYCGWLAAVAGIPFWRYGWITGLLGLLAVFALTFRTKLRMPPIKRLVQWELGFLTLLMVGILIKGSAADIEGLEKFMDFGFINGALRASSMPPPDPWWMGQPINYYYFGHVAAAWLIQLSGVPADHGFNLMVATVFAFAVSLTYRIVRGCLGKMNDRISVVCGLVAASLVAFGGNFHSVLYGPFRALSPTTYSRGFFYPDSTRFVGFDPLTDDRGFTEMPAYGFGVGDLHAHVLNLPVAFMILMIFARIVERETGAAAHYGLRWREIIILALLFAISAMSNSWDAVSYGLLLPLTGLLLLTHRKGRRLRLFVKLSLTAAVTVGLALVLASPFLVSFKPIASTLRWMDGRTPFWQLAVLYGHIALPCLILLVGLFVAFGRDPRWRVGALLALCALCLIALPEIVYVKDIYGADNRRANTMFKLAFEAQPIAMMASMILIGLLLQRKGVIAAVAALVLAAPLLATLSYADDIYRYRVFPMSERTFTLSGTGFIVRSRHDDMALIDWLRSQPSDRLIILVEAPGDSFTQKSRLSAFSGVPTIVGWRGHEWLWRGDISSAYRRYDEVAAFYNSTTLRQACALVATYGVTHVAIGTVEREVFPGINADIFRQLGPIVVQSGNSMIIQVEPASCAN
ncbi:DUF2298 domain-containing protein [Mesorhizobium sp. M7A.F.Ca.MR.362.00.0.0]|uniref:DUF2298 domain-containing protein n=1 Tax=Mesorhizobium sp. M7A.F.Ca.MR.362.00.0.0 TaxID=2496779 RepID=UPI000FD4F0BB|nr:DUF2298 domain-containing protein [Mesorhizobium sp. M7A.F.Ca.MR.362.00.0.0]RUU83259.1 hypothetical protein EOC06_00785 [Mesorhizobium sp. M7A.F.Ca.MR.362.00.0.0]RWN87902.1 MAG: hypothetical protein EOS05_31920 [Mesorhizobium sp.]